MEIVNEFFICSMSNLITSSFICLKSIVKKLEQYVNKLTIKTPAQFKKMSHISKPAFSCSKLIIETQDQGAQYVPS